MTAKRLRFRRLQLALKKQFNRSQKFFGYLLTIIAAAASTAAILGYRQPASFPIVKGIDIPGCGQWDKEETEAEIANKEKFLNDLQKNNRQTIFVDRLTFSLMGCEEWFSRSKRARDRFKARSNEYFAYEENTLQFNSDIVAVSGAVTIGFKKLFGGVYNELSITVAAPGKEEYFSDSTCGENCYGAHGLYKVIFTSNEGVLQHRLEPLAVTGGLIDIYQCTLAKLNAKTAWEKFSACRF